MSKLLAWFLPLVFCAFAVCQQTMNNDAVIRMVKAGLSDDIVVSTINASSGQYSTTPDALIALKQAGVSEKVIAAIVTKASPLPVAPVDTANSQSQPAPGTQGAPSDVAPPPGQSPEKPRVYLESASKGTNRNAARDQSMEMGKDLEGDCPAVRITISQDMADYTILLNHIEVGFARDNQIEVANKQGDLISRTKEGGSIRGGMKKACQTVLADWAKK
ncbi:MAG TPA: hypothetical protein VHX37_09290 [Acidobacteriaceae bacterium]|jgi:hypothetical protein|nr:hypothetical protein [Acidobacteriaceae bacterium]